MSITQLADRLFPGSVIVKTEELAGGLSATVTAVSLKNPSINLIVRKPLGVKWGDPEIAANEYRILALVHGLGLPAPEPLWLDATGELLDSPGLVMRRIDGEPDYDPLDRVGAARQMATQLARLHKTAVSPSGFSFLPSSDSLLELLIRFPAPIPDPQWNDAPIRDAVRQVWPVARRNPDTLLHGDFWPGNLLWQNGTLVGITDWEDAALGSPLLDFAIARLDTLLIYGDAAFAAFDAEYRKLTTHDFTNMPLWDMVAVLRLGRLIEVIAKGWPELGRPDITEAFIRKTLQKFAAKALENYEL